MPSALTCVTILLVTPFTVKTDPYEFTDKVQCSRNSLHKEINRQFAGVWYSTQNKNRSGRRSMTFHIRLYAKYIYLLETASSQNTEHLFRNNHFLINIDDKIIRTSDSTKHEPGKLIIATSWVHYML